MVISRVQRPGTRAVARHPGSLGERRSGMGRDWAARWRSAMPTRERRPVPKRLPLPPGEGWGRYISCPVVRTAWPLSVVLQV